MMSYFILVNDDDTLYCSKKERLMQRQKLVNDLIFVVNPIYRNTHDMTNASVLLEYILPVSKKYETEYLVLSDEKYKDYYLQYKLPIDSKLSAEAGEVELQLTFAFVEMDYNGNNIQRVRKTTPTVIKITKIADWASVIPDNALGGLDQRLLVINSQLQAIDEYMNVLDTNKIDNLVYDGKNEELYLSAKGTPIGDKISVRDILDEGIPVVDLNGSDGKPNTPNDNGCNCEDCNCDDNINVITF